MKTYLTSLAPSLTEESLQDIPIVLDSQYSQLEISNEPFQSTRVVISSSVGENPVSLMAQEVVPRKRGRPRGSKNKKKPGTSRPSCPEVGTQGGGTGRGRGRGRGQSRDVLQSLSHSLTMSHQTRRWSRQSHLSPEQVDVSRVEEVQR